MLILLLAGLLLPQEPVFDTHPDGTDTAALGFGRMWQAIQGQSMGGFPDAWQHLRQGLSGAELLAAEGALRQNTLSPTTLPSLAASELRLRRFLGPDSVPSWDR